jgi:Metallo-peptidase family M12B Reprolysin-like
MSILLREIASRCRGLQGSFSLVRDFFGYTGNSAPGSTSLTQELTLLRDNEHVTIHLKFMTTPTWAFTSGISVNLMLFSMRRVYNAAGVAVILGSTETIIWTDTDIFVDECIGDQVTDDQRALFNFRLNVGKNDIVVYLVRSVFTTDANAPGGIGTANGCATSPEGKPGAVVSAPMASEWTVAHEVGHVLGNAHIETGTCPARLMPPQPALCNTGNIMTCCGTGSIPAGTLPAFNPDQIKRIIDSDLSQLFED